MKYPRCPAAFINVIAEEGDKEEAITWLQKIWDELCFVRNQLEETTNELIEARREQSHLQNRYHESVG